MTNQAPTHRGTPTGEHVIDRKYVQKVKAAHEQRERTLARMVITALATCGTLVGWMLFAKPATSTIQPSDAAPSVPVATTEPLPPTAIVLSVAAAPIPTVVPLPTFAPLPTLVTVDYVGIVDAVAAPSAPDQANPQAPVVAPDTMPALRVVTMPVIPARPGRPNPSAPNPGGLTGGSK
jgi:hypothetical protein